MPHEHAHDDHDHDHEHEGHEAHGHEPEDTRIRLLHGSSPLCHWSFAYEPVLQRMRLLYGDQIKVNTYQIPVYRDWQQYLRDYELDPASLGTWMEEVRDLTGLPVNMGFFAQPLQDCLPITLAVHAAEVAQPGAGERLARAVGFAMAAEGRDLGPTEAVLKLADKARIPRKALEQALADGRAEARLADDLQSMHALGLNFYALQMRDFEGRTVTIEHAFEGDRVEEALDWLGRGKLRKHALPSVADYVIEHAPVSLRELEVVFQLDGPRARAAVAPAVQRGKVVERSFEGHPFWLPAGP